MFIQGSEKNGSLFKAFHYHFEVVQMQIKMEGEGAWSDGF